jgi:hypothetical protein
MTPAASAIFGHFYGGFKANLPGVGPGLHIWRNDATEAAIRHWNYFEANQWLFAIYGALLLATCLFLLWRNVRFHLRVLSWIVLSIPGIWYLTKMAYLGGKILLVG